MRAYGTWKQWRRRVYKAGILRIAIDSDPIPIDEPWMTEHTSQLRNWEPSSTRGNRESAQAIADRDAG